MDLRAHIRDIPDFPKPGIVFKDLTPLLLHPPALEHTVELLARYAGEQRDGEAYYDDTEREIIRAVTELTRYGVGGRNLRVFRTSADRESSLLEQILAPSLRSRNPERRREAVEALENLAATASHLKYLLLVRDLRRITS